MRNKDDNSNKVINTPRARTQARKFRYHVTQPSLREVSTHAQITAWLNAAEVQGWEFVTCGLHHQEGPVGQYKLPVACWVFRQPVEA